MTTKEKIIEKIEKLTPEQLQYVDEILDEINNPKDFQKKKFHSWNQGGIYDNIDVRKVAYE
jgi:hypothetical protein